MRTTLLGWGIAVSVLVASAGRGGEGEPTPIRVARAEVATVPVVEQVAGSVVARTRPTVAARLGGAILSLGAGVGDRVEAGQVLAELDAREVDARLRQALPQLDRARKDVERLRDLLGKQAVPQTQYDEAVARVQTMEATVEEARTALTHATVRSPIPGVVRARMVEVGDLATPGRPLFELEGVSDFRFEAAIPESLTGRLRRGDAALVRVDAVDLETTATLTEITPGADPLSRTFLARFDVETSAPLISGQFGRLSLPVGTTQELRVPRSAVVRRGQLDLVFVVGEGRARLRLVRVGRVDDREATVLAGLSHGESVVVEGAALLRDGQAVRILP